MIVAVEFFSQTVPSTKAQFLEQGKVLPLPAGISPSTQNILLLWVWGSTYPDAGAIILDLNQLQASLFYNHLNTCAFGI